MLTIKNLTLSELLANVEQIDPTYELYMPKQEAWTLDTPCSVIGYEDYADAEEDPQYALENNLVYVFGIETVRSIVSNARLQKAEVSLKELYDAFIYYYDHDAFLILERESQ